VNCAKCKMPISPVEPYFWGRDGGEWHATCFQRMRAEAGGIVAVRGMWYNTTGSFEPPAELAPSGVTGVTPESVTVSFWGPNQ
jgi:hypothetical protein